MFNFWQNVARFPRFFISSVLGLITVILSPIFKSSKDPFTRTIVLILLTLFILFLVITLRSMLDLQ
jgi:hypothetical protein